MSILNTLRNAKSKGKLLELIVVDIFKSLSLDNVTRQKSGSQYGFDVIGYHKDRCWKAECKNLKERVSINELAPKLIWHIDGRCVDKFIIVSVFGLSNDARKLLEDTDYAFDIEVWCEDYLEFLIYQSDEALKRLGHPENSQKKLVEPQPIRFPKNVIGFNVFYSQTKPLAFDYLILNNKVRKSFTDYQFKLSCVVQNNHPKEHLVIQNINVITMKYESTKNMRILRQRTMRGVYEPIDFKFKPENENSRSVNILEDKIIELNSDENEVITLTLDKDMKSGYYKIIIELDCLIGKSRLKVYSNSIEISKVSTQHNVVDLHVLKFYDSPSRQLLTLDERSWEKIKRRIPQRIKYLGPTILDRTYSSKTWKVHTIKLKKDKSDKGGLYSKGTSISRVLTDTKIPVEEKIYSANDIALSQMIDARK